MYVQKPFFFLRLTIRLSRWFVYDSITAGEKVRKISLTGTTIHSIRLPFHLFICAWYWKLKFETYLFIDANIFFIEIYRCVH